MSNGNPNPTPPTFSGNDRPLIEQIAVAYATQIEELQAEIERLRELKTPATRQLLNVTKGLLDHAETECAKLRTALEHMKLVAETDGLDQWVEFIDAALNEQKP